MIRHTLLKDPYRLAPGIAPVVRELPADLETPVSVYLKLAGQGPSFLLESVTGGEQLARYSFIGVNPSRAYLLRAGQAQSLALGQDGRMTLSEVLDSRPNPLDALREALGSHRYQSRPGLPRFAGGLVGFLSYEMMRYFEPSLRLEPHPEIPEAIFLLADTLVAFDHAFGRLVLIGNANPADANGRSPSQVEAQLDEIERRLMSPLPEAIHKPLKPVDSVTRSNFSQEAFCRAVERAKEHIAAGDIFQVVLSQRLEGETCIAPFDIYRALRRLNPSPYMFYFDFAELTGSEPLRLIGASPEMHCRLEGRTAAVRPIAGTRKRGRNPEEERILEEELLADPKERAEHVMLVDLGRNDLGRICRYGSVQVSEQMVIERYSHVIHLVSHVEGELRPEYDAFDLLQATFPAGTVSGAPKIRAMQIIDDLEGEARGPYAGVVGYFSYDGSMDTCIAIRTMVMRGQTISIQAGAGIVADSQPEREYQETLSKARALGVAVEMAEQKMCRPEAEKEQGVLSQEERK
jgi:anthranilate synthase component 1